MDLQEAERTRRVALLLVAVLLLAGLPFLLSLPTVRADTVTIQPNDRDAYIREDNANASFAGIQVKTHLAENWRALLQFNVSAIPEQAIVEDAELQLYCTQDSISEGVTIGIRARRVTSSWNATPTWYGQPGDTTTDEGSDACFLAGTWSFWDVTNIVQGWVNGTYTNHGFKLVSSSENRTPEEPHYIFKNRDDTPTNQRPKLVVTYSEPAPPGFEPAWLVVSYFNGFGGLGLPFETFQTRIENSTGTHRVPLVPWPVNASETVNITTLDFLGNEIHREENVSLAAVGNYTIVDISINVTSVYLIFSDGRRHLHQFEDLDTGRIILAYDAPTRLFADHNYSYTVFEDDRIEAVAETTLADLEAAVQVFEVDVTLKDVEVRYRLYDAAQGVGIPFDRFLVYANGVLLNQTSYWTRTDSTVTTVVEDFFGNEIYNETRSATSHPYDWRVALDAYSWKLQNQNQAEFILTNLTYNGSGVDKAEFVPAGLVRDEWLRTGDYTLNITYYDGATATSTDTFTFTMGAAAEFFQVASDQTVTRIIGDMAAVQDLTTYTLDTVNLTWSRTNETYDFTLRMERDLNDTFRELEDVIKDDVLVDLFGRYPFFRIGGRTIHLIPFYMVLLPAWIALSLYVWSTGDFTGRWNPDVRYNERKRWGRNRRILVALWLLAGLTLLITWLFHQQGVAVVIPNLR